MANSKSIALAAVVTGLFLASPVLAEEKPAENTVGALSKQSVAAIKGFAGELKKHLQDAMKSGGPANALNVCKTVAPSIAETHSKTSGLTIKRTALKVRNPENAPDDYELKVLQQFVADIAAGKDAKTMKKAEIVEVDGGKVFRFSKAIPTQKMCLRCHGENIAPELKARIDELYPEDKATGFKEGDLRGIFSISKKL